MRWAILLLPGLAACDGVVGASYPGESLLTVRGDLEVLPSDRGTDTLQLELIWFVEAAIDARVNQTLNLDDAGRIATYQIDLFVPPPDEALATDPETGGRIGFAGLFAYDDPRGEGPVDLSQIDPADYGSLLYRLRGGAERVLVAYAADAFPEGRVADALGGPIEPGYLLLRIVAACCVTAEGTCQDRPLEDCPPTEMTPIPRDEAVTVRLVDDPEDFGIPRGPDWLFF